MKTKQSLLTLRKVQIAKINSFQILGGGDDDEVPASSLQCFESKSRTISGNQTQTHTNAMDCEGNPDA